jgi:hypothetical protein
MEQDSQGADGGNLQGVLRKDPRGLLRESFNKCIMFRFLTLFPNNAAEQK